MKKILYSILVLLFISCKKQYEGANPTLQVNNQVNVTVIHRSDTIKLSGNDRNAYIGGALLYGIDQVSCTDNNSSGNVWFDITPTGTFPSSVKKAGTYNIKCTYVPRIKSYPGQSYYMKEIYDRDSVTITKMVGNYYAEGYFNAVCIDFYNNIDTVFVKGSFKGFLNQ